MERAFTYTIEEKDEGRKIQGFLREQGYSYQNIVELKKMPESIILNGIWSYMNTRLKTGDVLEVFIKETSGSEHIPAVDLPLNIVYEDEDIIVIDKPAGMPTHPSRNNYENSMANALAWYYKTKGQEFTFRCTNRLDRDTSGLIVVSKHMVSAAIMGEMVKNREFTREYLAICSGSVEPKEGRIEAPLGRRSGSIIERCVDLQNGERAVTNYKVVCEARDYSLVRLKLETGRTHQIRIHMKYLGYPLIGDYLYNPDMRLITRQALHSCHIAFRHPITGENMDFVSELPEDMSRIMDQQQYHAT